ncbi:hypothetical protein [Simiduia agarivorans]|uniref:MSHA biogenesis protein MshI n=1 Tax=Simiduia agarivorans (strain DSM 21679 / JCM 13881 / BCRC 17597 / SA1) TaxID=1117647 RepID=K4KGF1_SIMAS|nr:hypothetical protein [Simiduia agarivorans]AFU98061.1 MSHA biogenesis protein MshI [Simiduia agarivorans SA1 = DSM 21679]
MSAQQVNLYLPELRPRREWLLSSQALLFALAFVVLLLLLSVWGGIKNADLDRELRQAKQSLVEVEAAVVAMSAKIPPSRSALIQQEIAALKAELASRERIYTLIHQQNLGNSDGFGEPLLALARQHQSNLSIDRFALAHGGRQLYLAGNAINPEALPQYIQRLQTEPSLQGARFGRLVIERENARQVRFNTGPEPAIAGARK